MPFLGTLQSAGIAVSQGIAIVDRSDRLASSEAVPPAASQAGCSKGSAEAGGMRDSVLGTACASPVWSSWFDDSVNVGASLLHMAPPYVPSHSVLFAEVVVAPVGDDRCSVVSEKASPSEGLCAVMWFLFQLCPSFASVAPPALQKVCDFEGLFVSVAKPSVGEISTTLFYRVAELFSQACLHFQTALEAGKLPAVGLISRRKGPGACSELAMQVVAPFNSSLYKSMGNFVFQAFPQPVV